jgi:ornithine carbamoyltransferase
VGSSIGAAPGTPAKRDLISIEDLSFADISEIFAIARDLKKNLRAGRRPALLAGKMLAMIFEKPSLRTRVTFETGITHLGGSAIYLTPGDIRPGERESVADIARNLARWVDAIVARTFQHDVLLALAQAARIPVINGLTDLLHPCQVLTDCFTLQEIRGSLAGSRVVFVGDGNNVAHSWLHAAARLHVHFTIACPPGYEPHADIVAQVRREASSTITISHAVEDAVRNADVIYTDVWTSMGQERTAAARRRAFRRYQVNERLVNLAARDVLVMHCLPAHRGEEITDAVLDGPHSIVLEQAENRLHAQKGMLVWLFGRTPADVATARARPRQRAVGTARRRRSRQ